MVRCLVRVLATVMKNNFEAGLVRLSKFLASVGVSRTTGWRWVRAGALRIVNVYGVNYVTSEARAEFLARASAGEFSRVPNPPAQTPGQ